MPQTFTRSDWGARPAKPGPGLLFGSNVVGIALHWPAMVQPIGTVAGVKAALGGWQRFHMDGRGWSDIAYQEAVDQAGNRYVLRGLDVQSGANGNTDLNERYGALLLVLAPGETPSAAMVKTVRQVVTDHRRLFRNSTHIVGHGQIRPGGTGCPGPITQGLIDAGTFEPRVPTWRLRHKIHDAVKQATADGRAQVADRLRKIRDRLRP